MPANPKQPTFAIATFLLLALVFYIPSELCRHFAVYSEPLYSLGFFIRRTLGWFAPYFEHLAFGAGQSFGMGAIIWLLLALSPLLRKIYVPAKQPILAKIQSWILSPPYKHQEWLILVVSPLPGIVWSFEWEFGQASGRFKGGNPDGSVQFDQIMADFTGFILFIVISLVILFPLLRRTQTNPRRML